MYVLVSLSLAIQQHDLPTYVTQPMNIEMKNSTSPEVLFMWVGCASVSFVSALVSVSLEIQHHNLPTYVTRALRIEMKKPTSPAVLRVVARVCQ